MSFELIVYTAVPLSDEKKQRLSAELKEKYQTDGIAFSVDSSIIGGMKLVFRDHIEDYSVASKLRSLKKHLTSESESV